MSSESYKAIMALSGAEEFKEVVRGIQNLKDKVKGHLTCSLTMPAMLWIIQIGGGVTTMVALLAEYLSEEKVKDFMGEAKFIEFKLGYNSSDESFSELKRLHEAIKKNTGHRYDYRGILCVNIDEWIVHSTELYFLDFLEFIDYNRKSILTVFTTHSKTAKDIVNIEAVISSRMSLETITIDFPETNELLALIDDKFVKASGYSLSNDARELLSAHIKTRVLSSSFDGFKNIERLGEEIVTYAIKSTKRRKTITAELLSPYCEKQLNQAKALNSLRNKAPIGFEVSVKEY